MLICYHHTDLDGMSGAYCVHRYKPSEIEDSANCYYMCNYDSKFDKHTTRDDVFIVDISILEKTYPMLIEACRNARTVTWIDHHLTSKEVIDNHLEELQGIRNLTYFVNENGCGSLLAYLYFHFPARELLRIRQTEDEGTYDILARDKGNGLFEMTAIKSTKGNKGENMTVDAISHDIIIPEWLKYVDDFDRWIKQYPDTDYYQNGAYAEDISFTKKEGDQIVYGSFWMEEKFNNVKKLVQDGEAIARYNHNKFKASLGDCFEYTIGDTTFICKNGTGCSYEFEGLINKYKAAILFHYSAKSGKWVYSVYSGDDSTFNCTEFCKQFGGGGHFHASGFSTEKLIFTSLGFNAKEKNNTIFLGGTCGESDWRSKFINTWKKYEENHKDLKGKKIELFNPIVENWTPEDQKKEDEVKENAMLNIFFITPEQTGVYSFAEAVECVNNGSKVFFAIYDEYKQFDSATMKSFDAVGKIIESHNGVYEKYFEDDMDSIVRDVIASL